MSWAIRYASDEPWEEENPNGEGDHKKMSPKQVSRARKRAEDHGREYPNLVDNMWAMKN